MFTATLGALGGVSQSIANSVVAIAKAAANYWGRYIDTSLASIDIQIDFTNLGGTTLAQAGTDYYFAFSQGGLDYFDPATVIELTTGIDENGANPDISIEVDIASINANDFNFGPLVDGVSIGGGAYDLWTVLVHEIAHGLGLLTFLDSDGADRTSFDRHVTQSGGGYFFDGPDPNFGPIALDVSIAHFAENSGSILDPTIGPNIAIYLTERDLSVFGDIGAPVKRPTSEDDNLSSFGTTSNSVLPNPDLHALAGNDTLVGLPTADRLFGDDGNDSLYGSDGNDSLDGGEGADTLKGDVGADTMNGGNGTDTVDYSAGSAAVFVNLSTGTSGGAFGSDLVVSVEDAVGTSFGDSLSGAAGGNDVRGGGGNDTVSGGAGNDIIRGEDGNDRLYGDDGADTALGGNGNDLIEGRLGSDFLKGDGGNDFVLGGDGNDSLQGGDGDDNLRGENGNDVLFGDNGVDTVQGGAGVDELRGGAGDDLLQGGDDGDKLFGWGENDLLQGEAGNDFLKGDGGGDTLDGGDGVDSLQGNAGNDVYRFSPDAAIDFIGGFSGGAGASDRIELVGYGAAFDTFAEVMAAATQVGTRVVIDFGGGDQIQILNTTLAQINADDFIFS